MNQAFTDAILHAAIESIVFSAIGMVFFGIAFFLITVISPFSIRKEIEEDQNTALGIVIGAVILGVAMIVSAAMHG